MSPTTLGLPRVSSGQRAILVTLDAPGPPVPDGDGGFTTTYVPLDPPTAYANISTGDGTRSGSQQERPIVGTVIGSATLIITLPFHPGVTLRTRIQWTDAAQRPHTADVVGLLDSESRGVELTLAAVETVA